MFKPNYQLTPTLVSSIAESERLYGQLEALRLPRKLQLNLERDNAIQSAHTSNSIEGNPLSLPEVTNLLLNDRVPANRDEKEVKNYFDLLRNLPDYTDDEFDLDLITDIHKKLMSGVNDDIAGRIRDQEVIVGGYARAGDKFVVKVKHEPPFYQREQIKNALDQLAAWVKDISKMPVIVQTGIFHHQFVYLHPFVDGNGRVCRLLTALLFLKNDYLINKYFILDDYYDIDRSLYSDKLHSADAGDKTEWLEYFVDGVKYSLQSALARAKNSLQELGVAEQPTPRERDALKIIQRRSELTSADLAERLDISRQQAYNLLDGLLEKGLINKKGRTKGSYYYI